MSPTTSLLPGSVAPGFWKQRPSQSDIPARQLQTKLVEIATAFAVDEKVSAVIHNQAANMELSLQISNSNKGWESLRCNAYCLQLYLKARLSNNGISRLLGASQKLVGDFRHSVVATKELKRHQVQMETGSEFIQDCPTHWNSSFYMLERIVEMH